MPTAWTVEMVIVSLLTLLFFQVYKLPYFLHSDTGFHHPDVVVILLLFTRGQMTEYLPGWWLVCNIVFPSRTQHQAVPREILYCMHYYR